MVMILMLYLTQIQEGLAVSLREISILKHSYPEKNWKKVEKISKCFFEKSFYFNEILDIPVIKGQLALNIPKRASHNSF